MSRWLCWSSLWKFPHLYANLIKRTFQLTVGIVGGEQQQLWRWLQLFSGACLISRTKSSCVDAIEFGDAGVLRGNWRSLINIPVPRDVPVLIRYWSRNRPVPVCHAVGAPKWQLVSAGGSSTFWRGSISHVESDTIALCFMYVFSVLDARGWYET